MLYSKEEEEIEADRVTTGSKWGEWEHTTHKKVSIWNTVRLVGVGVVETAQVRDCQCYHVSCCKVLHTVGRRGSGTWMIWTTALTGDSWDLRRRGLVDFGGDQLEVGFANGVDTEASQLGLERA